MTTPLLADKAIVFRSAREGFSQQERGKPIAATGVQGAVPWDAGRQAIAANQAQHLSVFQNMLFGRPINVSFPQAMSIQEVSNVMDGFTA